MNAKILLISLTLAGLSGCSFLDKVIEPLTFTAQKKDKIRLDLKDPSPISTKKVTWIIVTPENAEEVFKEFKKKKISAALFALTDDGYKALSMNMVKIRSYILSQKEVTEAYREYYEPTPPPKKVNPAAENPE
jgi:hypothetical protein